MELKDYAGLISLYEKLERPPRVEPAEEEGLLFDTLAYIMSEADYGEAIPEEREDRLNLFRNLLTIRPAGELIPEVRLDIDRLLWSWRLREGIVRPDEIPSAKKEFSSVAPHADTLALWQGDIRRLGVDAIVNAANESLLGCFMPMHECIDNAIHGAAGPELRLDCKRIMKAQGGPESAGRAKITRAYNLPSRFVLHTVGPIVEGDLTSAHVRSLEESYRSCLALAAKIDEISSVAFCCVSTGVFGFPPDEAARVAVRAVRECLEEWPGKFAKVIFDVFTREDYERYRSIL